MDKAISDYILSKLDCLLFEYQCPGYFYISSTLPTWSKRFPRLIQDERIHIIELIDIFTIFETPFLEIDYIWIDTNNQFKTLNSWSELLSNGQEIHLKSMVISMEERRFILIQKIDEEFVKLIRKSREDRLNSEYREML